MVGTGNPTLFDAPVQQRRASVRTMVLDEANIAALIPEEHQIFGEDADEPGGLLVQLLSDRYGVPVAAKELACGRARAHPGYPLVFLSGQHSHLSQNVGSVHPVHGRWPKHTSEAIETLSMQAPFLGYAPGWGLPCWP